MNEIIYYLAHPWASNPELSFRNAITWTQHLRQKGYFVFSPILHTHPYWKEITKKCCCDAEKAGYGIGHAHDQCIGCEYSSNIFAVKWQCNYPYELKEYIETEDWLAWDLAILGSFRECIVLLSNTAYRKTQIPDLESYWKELQKHPEKQTIWETCCWISQGCRQEYEFAKTHGIPVYELEAFLNGAVVEL